MTAAIHAQTILLASEFDEEFKDWVAEGYTSTALYILAVLAIVAIVLKATS